MKEDINPNFANAKFARRADRPVPVSRFVLANLQGLNPNGFNRARQGNPDRISIAKSGIKIVTQNRKARYEYFIIEKYEAGISLTGPEVKSLRNGQVNLKDSFGGIEKEEVFLHKVHISAYDPAHQKDYNPTRTRKLLLHKQEIKKLAGRIKERGLTLVPLDIYFKNGKAKVSLALAKGKKVYDKRETLRKRTVERETRRAIRGKEK